MLALDVSFFLTFKSKFQIWGISLIPIEKFHVRYRVDVTYEQETIRNNILNDLFTYYHENSGEKEFFFFFQKMMVNKGKNDEKQLCWTLKG